MNFNTKRLCYINNKPYLWIHYLSIFFFMIKDEGPRWKTTWNIKDDAFFSKKVANQGLFYPFTVPLSSNALFEKLKLFYVLKSPKTHAILGQYRFLSAVNLEKWRMKLHNYALLRNFLELALLSLLNIHYYW